MKKLCLFLAFTLVAFAADDLGVIDFPNSGAEAAQKDFVRGVLLLHNFQYPDAAKAFQAAQQADPGFALAYWGEAMTHNHGLWMEQDLDKARAVLAKLAPDAAARIAKAPTEREKGYLRAVEALYGEGSKLARDLAYMEEMRQLQQKHPSDMEAASFYALSILASAEGERDFRTYMKAGAIALGLAEKNPRHPGAIHYVIHSFDDPIHAPLGLAAARTYAEIAPAATHALHMPSHIFLALGMWDDVVASNIVSFEASKGRSYHALHWLGYGYLQQGKHAEAAKMLETMRQSAANDKSPTARWYLAVMQAAYAVETREWKATDFPVDTTGIEYSATAADLFARGASAVHSGRLDEAAQILDQMKTGRIPVEKIVAAGGAVCHQTNSSAGISPNGLKGAAVMEKQLEGMILLAKDKTADAIAVLEEAARGEDVMSLDFGPPIPVKPAHELLGEVLLEQGKYAEAREHFQQALVRAPKRALSLAGLAKAEQSAPQLAAR
jgi:tetratricopeptide (TPR) repeat protein